MENKHNIKVEANLIASYKNGNYDVELYDDGTKVRFGEVDDFIPEFPENIDVCITKRCDGGCPYCYEGCTINGEHGDIGEFDRFGNFHLPKWMESLKPGTELALNGNDLTHPFLEHCLYALAEQGIITNMTINQRHLANNITTLIYWQQKGWIHGLGISLSNSNDEFLYTALASLKNVVLHVIAGIFTMEDMMNLQSVSPKLLILGYKNIGRGADYMKGKSDMINANIEFLKINLPIMQQYFEVLSFDNLAIEQLDVKNTLFKGDENKWSTFYMGDDGGFTMYIDTVNGKYSKNSCMPANERYKIDQKTTIDMFNDIRQRYGIKM
jgi:hypothetical protein